MAVWGDDRELDFLRHLGSWSPQTVPNKRSNRKQLIRKYYNTMHLRCDWGDVDPNKVRSYLRECGGHR